MSVDDAPTIIPDVDDVDDVDLGAEPDPAPTDSAAAAAGEEPTGISLALLDKLRPYLAESLMVLDQDWTVTANLAPPGGLIGRGLGLGLHTLEDMHPDDAVRIMDLGIEAFSTTAGWQGSRIVRMRNGDGAYGRYEITAINQFDDPVIQGMVVRTREVPQHLTAEVIGLRPASAIETLAELLPIGVLLLDRRGRVVFANDTACGMLDREPEALKRDGIDDLVEAGHSTLVQDILRRATDAPGREECTIQLTGARVEWVHCRVHSEGTDEVACVVMTMEDVTERQAAHRELEQRANYDPLTGLRNRASLHDLLQDRIARDEPTAVAYLDLDGFKAVNDTWGHERGDRLLMAVASALRAGLDPQVDIARLGGDEFVIVAPPSEADDSLGDRLRGIVKAVAYCEGLAVTCSVGVGRCRRGDSSHSVLRRADRAMYMAKAARS